MIERLLVTNWTPILPISQKPTKLSSVGKFVQTGEDDQGEVSGGIRDLGCAGRRYAFPAYDESVAFGVSVALGGTMVMGSGVVASPV